MHDGADRFPTVCKLFGCGSVVKEILSIQDQVYLLAV